jgi:Protein of unknown function (DUF2934)
MAPSRSDERKSPRPKDKSKTPALPRKSGRRRTGRLLPPESMSPEVVAQRAYELFLERGGSHGRDLDDWLHAERELGSTTRTDSNETA